MGGVTIKKDLAAPIFTTQPESAKVAAGQAVTFTAATKSDVEYPLQITLQWQENRAGASGNVWKNIEGANAADYEVKNADTVMNGWQYRCVASNLVGETTSTVATLSLKSTDTTVTKVTVDGVEGTVEGTTITVELPYGTSLPTEADKISIEPTQGATVSDLTASDDGSTWTFTVTAEDGTTAEYTIEVSVAEDPAADNKKAVAKAKARIEAVTDWTVAQTNANTERTVTAWIESKLDSMELQGVACTVSIKTFAAATAGDRANPSGTDGSFTFDVNLSKGEDDTLAEETLTVTGGTITATRFDPPPQLPSVSITLSQSEASVTAGKTVRLTADAAPSSAKITWSSGNESVAAVSSDGTVTGIAPGTAEITATAKLGSQSKTASCTFTVTETASEPSSDPSEDPSPSTSAAPSASASPPASQSPGTSWSPDASPSGWPSVPAGPSASESSRPTYYPSSRPTAVLPPPSVTSGRPTSSPTAGPSVSPSAKPSASAGASPSAGASESPTGQPTAALPVELKPETPGIPADVTITTNPDSGGSDAGSILTGIPIGSLLGSGEGEALTPETITVAVVKTWIKIPSGTGYEIRILTAQGKIAGPGGPIATGMRIEVLRDGKVIQSTAVVISGDVLGTGIMNIAQLVRMARDLNGIEPLVGVYRQAALFTGGSRITIADIVQCARLLLRMGGSIEI